jgi:protein SCO1/2
MICPKWNHKQVLILVTASWLGAAVSVALAVESDSHDPSQHTQQQMDHSQHGEDHSGHMDHSQHGDDHSGHMDHSQHGDDHSAHMDHAGHEDHSKHMAMMNQSGYKRSEHAYPLKSYELVDMQGQDTDLLQALTCEHPVMINFIFTTCTTICPVMSATFSQVQTELGPAADEVCMVSFSIDPEYDTPVRLREYAQRFEAGPQWQFYTGTLEDMIAVQKAFDVFRGSKMNHEPTTLLRGSPDSPWVRIDGIASAKEIVKEYQGLLNQ